MAPGTDKIFLTRHNAHDLYDIDGYQLSPGFVLAELAELDLISPRNDQETCLATPVPRPIPEFLHFPSEGTFDYSFHGITKNQALEICSKRASLPLMPKPEGQLVVRRTNLMLPGDDPMDLPVDVWVPSPNVFHFHARVALLISALEEMQSLPPTPGRVQEIRKSIGHPRLNIYLDWRGDPYLDFDCKPSLLLKLLRLHDSAFSPKRVSG